jgi:hypothetical protein
VQACWNCNSRGWNNCNRLLGGFLAACLQHSFGHFLDEQWNAVRALDNVLSDARREGFIASDVVDHGGNVVLTQPVYGKCCDVRSSNPRRLKFWPVRDDQQHAKGFDPIHCATECLKARGIGPMRILENHQHRIGLRQLLHLRSKRFHRSVPALLRHQFECGVAAIVRQRQHLGKERCVPLRGRGLRQDRIELVEPRLHGVVVRQSGGTFHLANDRIKRAVGVLWRAEIP